MFRGITIITTLSSLLTTMMMMTTTAANALAHEKVKEQSKGKGKGEEQIKKKRNSFVYRAQENKEHSMTLDSLCTLSPSLSLSLFVSFCVVHQPHAMHRWAGIKTMLPAQCSVRFQTPIESTVCFTYTQNIHTHTHCVYAYKQNIETLELLTLAKTTSPFCWRQCNEIKT